MRAGLLAEFETPERLLDAARALREAGLSRLDGFTPFRVHGAEEAFGIRRSRLPWVVLGFGLLGASSAYFLQWFTAAVDYELDVGGRPPHSPAVFVPITFEMGVLFAAFSALITVLVWAGLPRLWDPVFEVSGFERASIDRFWIGVDRADPCFDRDLAEQVLRDTGALRIVDLPEEPA
jgi:hypothetical protein